MKANPRIAVLGGGFGGLESLFYLKYKQPQTLRRSACSNH